jgi:hypothetical protein
MPAENIYISLASVTEKNPLMPALRARRLIAGCGA